MTYRKYRKSLEDADNAILSFFKSTHMDQPVTFARCAAMLDAYHADLMTLGTRYHRSGICRGAAFLFTFALIWLTCLWDSHSWESIVLTLTGFAIIYHACLTGLRPISQKAHEAWRDQVCGEVNNGIHTANLI